MSASQFPPLQSKPSSRHCTNCSAKMSLYALPGHYGNTVEIDACMDCNAIWFDSQESTKLSPDGTVALFQLIHECGGAATASAKFGEGLRCPVCSDSMRLTHDQVKGTRFTYQACRSGHGRFTTFYNFLAEKQFVRELTRAERAKLAATVQQVRCSGCGAAVNIGRVDACEYCRAPVSVFDREAAKKAIDHYLLARQKQVPSAANVRREFPRRGDVQWSSYDRSDLGADILFALGRAATRMVSGGGRAASVGTAGAATEVFADSTAAIPDATAALFGTDAASSMTESLGSALPSATDALFGGVSDVASGVSGTALESVGDLAASAGEGVVDLVTDGIGSLLSALFD